MNRRRFHTPSVVSGSKRAPIHGVRRNESWYSLHLVRRPVEAGSAAHKESDDDRSSESRLLNRSLLRENVELRTHSVKGELMAWV